MKNKKKQQQDFYCIVPGTFHTRNPNIAADTASPIFYCNQGPVSMMLICPLLREHRLWFSVLMVP